MLATLIRLLGDFDILVFDAGWFAERWARVDYITIPTRRDAIAAAHTLVLKP